MTETITTRPPLDWDDCMRIANNNKKTAYELIYMFIKDLPRAKEDINSSYSSKQANKLRKEVHKLLGASCYCGAPHIKNTLEKINNLLARNTNNNIDQLMKQLNLEIDEAMTYFREELLQQQD